MSTRNPRTQGWTGPSTQPGRTAMRTAMRKDSRQIESKQPKSVRQPNGFTLMELMIVMMIIGVLATLAIPSYVGAMRSAREAVLKQDLQTMRTAIDSYTEDKQKGPQSLDDLVQDGYLKEIPVDPITRSKETWVTDTSDSLHSLDQTDPGVDNVHSGSTELGADGKSYAEW